MVSETTQFLDIDAKKLRLNESYYQAINIILLRLFYQCQWQVNYGIENFKNPKGFLVSWTTNVVLTNWLSANTCISLITPKL